MLELLQNGAYEFLEKSDIKEILEYAESSEKTNLPEGKLLSGEFMDAYAKILADTIRAATGEEKPLAEQYGKRR